MLREMIDGLDVDHPLPLYQQLQRSIRQAIHRQALGPGDALPAERDIAEELEISRITVRKALDGLVGEGLLTRRQGAGTFVTARVEKSFSKLSSFTEDMRARGVRPHSEWLTRSCGSVTPDEAMMLGLSPGAAVLRFHRIRFGDDKRAAKAAGGPLHDRAGGSSGHSPGQQRPSHRAPGIFVQRPAGRVHTVLLSWRRLRLHR